MPSFDCDGMCCSAIAFSVELSYDHHLFVMNTVICLFEAMAFFFVFFKLNRGYTSMQRQLENESIHTYGSSAFSNLLTSAPTVVHPYYYTYIQFACIWFVLQALSLLVPNGDFSAVMGHVLYMGHAFLDNFIIVFAFQKKVGMESVKRTMMICGGVVVAKVGVMLTVTHPYKCAWCPLFYPAPQAVWIYLFFTVCYLAAVVVTSEFVRQRWPAISPRKSILPWVAYLAVDYGIATVGAGIAASEDYGFCLLSTAIIMYCTIYAPLLYRTLLYDSREIQQQLENELVGSDNMRSMLLPDGEVQFVADETTISTYGSLEKTKGKTGDEEAGSESPWSSGNSLNTAQVERERALYRKLAKELKGERVNFIEPKEIKLVRRIGVGGFGEVFRGSWKGVNVAVKKLFSFDGNGKTQEQALKEFLKEVSMMSGLQHPNVVHFMGVVLKRNYHAMVLEFVENGSLFDYLHSGEDPLPEEEIYRFAMDTARGMSYLHGHNPKIIHRDLKSHNLLIDSQGHLKVCDFGLSRIKVQTEHMTKIGTIQWASPELLRDEEYNESVDVFSFGVILWEMVTRKVPYEGKQLFKVGSEVAFKGCQLELPQDMDQDLAEVIRACWHLIPEKRPSFDQLLERFQQIWNLRKFETDGKGKEVEDEVIGDVGGIEE